MKHEHSRTDLFPVILSPVRSLTVKKQRTYELAKWLLEDPSNKDLLTNVIKLSKDEQNDAVNTILFEQIMDEVTQNPLLWDSLAVLAKNGYKPPLIALHNYIKKYPSYEFWKKLCELFKINVTSIVGLTDDDLPEIFHVTMIADITLKKWFQACDDAQFYPNLYIALRDDYKRMTGLNNRLSRLTM